MEISENERIILDNKKEEIFKITAELLSGGGSISDTITKLNRILSLLSRIESYAKPDRDLSVFPRLVVRISLYLESGMDASLLISTFCTAVNSIKFDFTKKRLILPKTIIENIENLFAKIISSPDHSNLLSKKMLHPIIAKKIWSAFVRSEYDTAIFQAFKEVEVAVRDAGGFLPTDIGISLMRKAFDNTTGPLTDKNSPQAEREAIQHLFAGAIGLYKNPQSHRNVPISDPSEAIEMIILASHLLKIVDARRQSTGQCNP